MSKKTASAVQTAPVDPTSIKDAAYRFALQSESNESIVRYVLKTCPGFATDVPKEVREELNVGFQLRKHELTGDKFYKVGDGGTMIPVNDPTGLEGLTVMNINTAMVYTPNEFGKMRESDPARHAVVKDLRNAFSTYASGRLSDMQAIAKRLQRGDAPRARAVNKGFHESLKSKFDELEKRVKTAQSRGDTEADPAKFKVAVAAFWSAYNG